MAEKTARPVRSDERSRPGLPGAWWLVPWNSARPVRGWRPGGGHEEKGLVAAVLAVLLKDEKSPAPWRWTSCPGVRGSRPTTWRRRWVGMG